MEIFWNMYGNDEHRSKLREIENVGDEFRKNGVEKIKIVKLPIESRHYRIFMKIMIIFMLTDFMLTSMKMEVMNLLRK